MAYIPSWTEQNQGNISFFLQQMMDAFAPDAKAQRTFQQLAQADPSLVENISNMDDAVRETYSKQVLGAKNKNPIAKIGVGAKRQERERIAAMQKTLTPAQLAKQAANQLNTNTVEEITREGIKNQREDELAPILLAGAKAGLKANEQQIEKGDLELQAARQQHERNQRLIAALPKVEQDTIKELADSIVYNKPFRGDPQTAERVKNDKVYSSLLDDYITSGRNNLEQNAQKDLAALRTPQEKMWGFQFFKDAADNARADRDKAQEALTKMGPLGAMMNAQDYALAQANLASKEENYKTMNNAYIDYGKEKLGVSVESPEDQIAASLAKMVVDGNKSLRQIESDLAGNKTMIDKIRKILQTSARGMTVPKLKEDNFNSPLGGQLFNKR